ncbi:MAG: hypothetical protein CMO06_16035 [Thalassospira sp.]|nr:hypothetical protein [Thalassospira sp.]MAZ33914.1 hypothetical protein [Thalassospira sp.]MAZ34649.1 hypothetical protein [Thalassospira sp.]
MIDHVDCAKVEVSCKQSLTSSVNYTLRSLYAVVPCVNEAVLVVAYLPVNFIIRNVPRASLTLLGDNNSFIISATAYVDAPLLLFLYISNIKRSPHKVSTSISDNNALTRMSRQDGTADDGKGVVRNIFRASPETRDDVFKTRTSHTLKEVELVGCVTKVDCIVSAKPYQIRVVGVAPIDYNIVTARAEPTAVKTKAHAVKATSKGGGPS